MAVDVTHKAITPSGGRYVLKYTDYIDPTQHEFSTALVRSATLVVAASDASTASQEGADYLCDGTDDDVQIQAAIDALPAGGGKILLTEGEFSFTTAVAIEADNILIEGQGKATSIDLAAVGINGFVFGDGTTERQKVGIRNLLITSSVVKNAGAAIKFNKIRFGYADHFYTENQYYGVEIAGACVWTNINNFEIINCIAATGKGIYIQSNSTGADTLISTGIISSPGGASAPAAGISMKNVRGCYLTDITCAYNKTGLLIDPDTTRGAVDDYVSSVLATQCLFDSNTERGILVSPGAGFVVRQLYFNNCWTSANTLTGAYIGLSGVGTITGVWLTSHHSLFNGEQGVVLNYGTNLNVHNSEISDNSVTAANTSDGIVVAADIDEFSLINNRCGNYYTGGGTQRYGYFIIAGTGDNYRIIGNDLRGNGTGGMLNGATGTTKVVRDNIGHITENSGTATLLSANTSVVVAHGCDGTPTVINISWRENPTNAIGDWWIDTIGAVNFTLNGVDPGASNLDFGWEAKVR